MGFDPRDRSAAAQSRTRQRVTSNLEALVAENEALRREVHNLRRELERLREQSPSETAQQRRSHEPSAAATPRISPEQVERWCEALSQQDGWCDLRLNDLQALIDQLNRSSFHPQLNLQQRLDRLVPGLGRDLQAAVAVGCLNQQRCAVLTAFALYGVRASEWLDEDPARVVAELRQRLRHLQSGRRTRSDYRSTDRRDDNPVDQIRAAALAVLGLPVGATQEAIKQAHRNLVKRHHPDMGGSADAFRRVNEAYQVLVA
ncbi:MAG: molecular chaperone DnaJ [Blastopirellula sp.]|nr:molecular chaperone DnaJ [Blastopirellula sp.]MAR08657.1 molecular chaperone DnaJ [Blastopirellula sp.]|tara:strand:+ start:2351 stop:3127 length:777 start_codon:yes stop_codon:yes gene_type:complete